jgi:hypothetical protein
MTDGLDAGRVHRARRTLEAVRGTKQALDVLAPRVGAGLALQRQKVALERLLVLLELSEEQTHQALGQCVAVDRQAQSPVPTRSRRRVLRRLRSWLALSI